MKYYLRGNCQLSCQIRLEKKERKRKKRRKHAWRAPAGLFFVWTRGLFIFSFFDIFPSSSSSSSSLDVLFLLQLSSSLRNVTEPNKQNPSFVRSVTKKRLWRAGWQTGSVQQNQLINVGLGHCCKPLKSRFERRHKKIVMWLTSPVLCVEILPDQFMSRV